jgi:hypothetical protein
MSVKTNVTVPLGEVLKASGTGLPLALMGEASRGKPGRPARGAFLLVAGASMAGGVVGGAAAGGIVELRV